MASTASVVGVVKDKGGKFSEGMRTVAGLLLLVLIVVGGFLLWRHYHGKTSTVRPGPSSISDAEQANQSGLKQELASGDLHAYQINQRVLANQYLNSNDPGDAERVMNEVFNKVPADKVEDSTYIVMIDVEKANKNTTQYKHYIQLLIPKLNSEGNTALAAVYQKALNGQ